MNEKADVLKDKKREWSTLWQEKNKVVRKQVPKELNQGAHFKNNKELKIVYILPTLMHVSVCVNDNVYRLLNDLYSPEIWFLL